MMKPLQLNVAALPLLLLLAACAGTAPRTAAPRDTLPGPRTTAAATPADDLRAYRLPLPAVPPLSAPAANAPALVPKPAAPPPTNMVNAPMEQRLRDQAVTNQNIRYAQGYRLLVYLGLDRGEAMAIRRAVISRYPGETDYLSFKAPVYRLYVGDYLTRLDAARARARLHGLTPRADVEATQVLLNKNL